MRRPFSSTGPFSLLAVAALIGASMGCTDLEPAGPGIESSEAEAERLRGPRGGGQADLVAIPLGTLGGQETMALSINDRGRVVGWSHNEAGATRPFIWSSDEGMRDLGTLGGAEGVAMAINDAGIAVGWSLDAGGRQLATRWTSDGDVIRLEEHPFGADEAPSAATAVNARGEAVGFTHGVFLARWDPEGRALGMDGCSGGFAFGINDAGGVTGIESTAVGAFLYDPELAAVREYSGFIWRERDGCTGLIDEAFLSHDAVALNNRGVVVGLGGEHREFDPPEPGLLVLTTSGVPFLHGPRSGFDPEHPGLPAEPRDINDHGVVVGDGMEGINRAGDRVGGAFLWTSRPGAFGAGRALVASAEERDGVAVREAIPAQLALAAAAESAHRLRVASAVPADCPAPVAHLVRVGALPTCR